MVRNKIESGKKEAEGKRFCNACVKRIPTPTKNKKKKKMPNKERRPHKPQRRSPDSKPAKDNLIL
jgi:hypothetical protein